MARWLNTCQTCRYFVELSVEEAHAVHAGIELEMHGIIFDTISLGFGDERVEFVGGEYGRFESVGK